MKKNKNKKQLGTAAAEKTGETQETTQETREEESEETEVESEEDSPRQITKNRAARVGLPPPMTRKALIRGLNEELSNMSEEGTKEWGGGVFKGLKAKSAKTEYSPVVL